MDDYTASNYMIYDYFILYDIYLLEGGFFA